MKLKVYPNVFTALGPDGMPAGRVPVEPGHPRPFDILGGKLRRVRLERPEDKTRSPKERAAAKKLDTRESRVSGVAEVRMRLLELDASPYFKQRVASGDLIAADLATAKAGGIAAKDFKVPLELLSSERKARIKEWIAINGEPPAVAALVLVLDAGEIKLAPRPAKRTSAPAVEEKSTGQTKPAASHAAGAALPTAPNESARGRARPTAAP